MERPQTSTAPTRNLALELVRVTEAAALGAARHMGRGNKNAADKGAVAAQAGDTHRHICGSTAGAFKITV